MDQPENQFEHAPAYSAPVPQQQDVPVEPAQMNWFQRLVGVLLSPTETFTDVNRKPTIIAPIIVVVILVLATVSLINWKISPYIDDIMRAQIKKQVERQGATVSEEQMQQQLQMAQDVRVKRKSLLSMFSHGQRSILLQINRFAKHLRANQVR